MDVILTPGKLAGAVTVPSSKSMAHRYLLCAALAHGKSRIGNVSLSADIEATLRGAAVLGAVFSVSGREVTVSATGFGRTMPKSIAESPGRPCGS